MSIPSLLVAYWYRPLTRWYILAQGRTLCFSFRSRLGRSVSWDSSVPVGYVCRVGDPVFQPSFLIKSMLVRCFDQHAVFQSFVVLSPKYQKFVFLCYRSWLNKPQFHFCVSWFWNTRSNIVPAHNLSATNGISTGGAARRTIVDVVWEYTKRPPFFFFKGRGSLVSSK